jgi:mono/diheme cytochrome c family protein
MFRYTILMLLLSTSIAAVAQIEIKKVPAPYTSAASGQEMYVSYCASCHGRDGKGAGPATPALKQAPPDLTALAKQNKGSFPHDHVIAVITGKAELAAHGSKEMPVWGPVFWKISQGHPEEVQQRVANLANYLKSIQAK